MCMQQERTKRSLPCQAVGKYCSSPKDKATVTLCRTCTACTMLLSKVRIEKEEKIQWVDSQHSYRYPT